MKLGSAEHKAQYIEDVIKMTQENIWTLEVQKLDAESHLRQRKAYLELIPKRMAEKFYPSANEGRQDEKDTQNSIINLTANVDKLADLIELEQRKIEMIKHWAGIDSDDNGKTE